MRRSIVGTSLQNRHRIMASITSAIDKSIDNNDNVEKRSVTWSQDSVSGILGVLWDTKELRVFLPEDKIRGFRHLRRTLLSNPSLALAQRYLGKAIFARQAVQLGRMFLRPLQMAVITLVLKSDRLVLKNDARE